MVENKIEVLGLDLFQTLKAEMDIVTRLQGYYHQGIGWHYYLDLAWMLRQIGSLPSGAIILDAGAGTGLAQFILCELGYNVISVDYANRAFSKTRLDRYANIIHYLNDQGAIFDNEYARHIEKTYGINVGKDEDRSPPGHGFRLPSFVRSALSRHRAIRLIRRECLPRAPYVPLSQRSLLGDDPRNYCGRIFIYKADLRQMPLLRDNCVDAVISISSLEHNSHENLSLCIREIERIAKPDSIFALTVSASQREDWFHEPSKGWCYSEDSLRRYFHMPVDASSNFSAKDALFAQLQKEGNELHRRLADFYFKSGDNGMPWGRWSPEYQPVGVAKRLVKHSPRRGQGC